MEIYEAIRKRRTIRDFQDKAVEMDTIEHIISAGLKAPSNDHMRNWEFVVITDKEERIKLIQNIPKLVSQENVKSQLDNWNMHDEKQRKMYMDAIPKQYSMLYDSSCLILPFFKQKPPLLQPERISSLNSFASIWMCIENILLAATAEGLFGVVRIPDGEGELQHIKETIKHPDNYFMPCYISLGYPATDAVIIEQNNFSAKVRMHLGKW